MSADLYHDGKPVRDGMSADDPFRHKIEFSYLIHDVSRLTSTWFDQFMDSLNLTHAQWWALMHLLERPGISQTDLADLMQMGRASAGKLLDRMEQKGWLDRRGDPVDARIRRVYLTTAVEPVLKGMRVQSEEFFRQLLRGVRGADVERLIPALRRMGRNAEDGMADRLAEESELDDAFTRTVLPQRRRG